MKSCRPLTAANVRAIEQRLRGQWTQQMTMDVAEVKKFIRHIRWHERRLERIEAAISPLVEDVRAIANSVLPPTR